ncbi:MAG: MBL fold metallo-hydrolase [Anaeroplasmataceae bacterium]|nr:MBL fold metallo-hydrolase [Anaeroplasmataceae bacterium]
MIETIVTGEFQTNTYIISNQGKCVIVDPGLDFAYAAAKLKEKYKVEAILLTHGHIDHIDGIRYFDVPIYIHEAELAFLEDASLSLYQMFGSKMPFQKENLQVIPIQDGMELRLIGYTFKVTHTPGHTRGSVIYSYNNKILSGDTLFHMSMGRTDFPTGDSLKMRYSLKRILEDFKGDYDVYPGHDSKTTLGLERRYNPYL